MNLEDYPHYFLYAIVIYMITAAFGMNFLLASVKYGILEGVEGLMVSAIILLPLAFLALYALNRKSYLLYQQRKALRILAVIAMLVSAVFTTLFIIPLSF